MVRGLGRGFGHLALNQKGYTLAEMTAVVAVTATLTALSIPVVMEKIEQGKSARVAGDLQTLVDGYIKFIKSTATLPAVDRAGTKDQIQLLTVGRGNDPTDNTGTWGRITRRDDAFNHLVEDSPEGTEDGYTNAGISWDGPYIGDVREDPWGNNYYIYVEPLYTAELATVTDRIIGWIISAGPNGVLETSNTSPTLNDRAVDRAKGGDDLGIMIGKANVNPGIQ